MYDYLLKKYRGMNLQIKIAFWFTIVGFLSKGISVITTPIFTRVLTTNEYGLFSVFTSWYAVLAVVATLNLHLTAIYNALTKYNDSKGRIVSSFQSVSLCVSLTLCVFAIIFSEVLSNIMKLPQPLVVFMFICFVFVEPYQLWLVYERYNYNYKKPVIFTIIISILTPIVSLNAIFLGDLYRGESRIYAYMILNTILPGLIFYIINYKKSKIFLDIDLWKYAVTFAVPLIPHYLSETILNQTDKIMINAYFGTSEAGIYNIAFTAASFVQIFASAINCGYIPWQFQKLQKKEYKRLENVSCCVLLFLAIMIAIVTLFAPEIVYVLSGENYMGAVNLIPTLGASVFFGYMYQLFARIEMYCEKKMYTVAATFTATLLNIVLNCIFMPKFGYTFAGVSTLIAHILFCAMHYYFYKKVCKECLQEANIYNAKKMIAISILLLTFALLTTWAYNYLAIRLIALITLIIVLMVYRKRILSPLYPQ